MLSVGITAIDSPHLSRKNLGTGNVLFQLASIYGIAKDHNRPCEFTSLLKYCQKIHRLFGYTHETTLYRKWVSMITSTNYDSPLQGMMHEKAFSPYLIDCIRNNPNKNIMVHGHLEYPHYFHKYREDILRLFEPDEQTLNYITNSYEELKTHNVISIHIRTASDANTRCGMNYYKKAIEYVQNNVDNPFYYVFSDGEVDMSEYNISHRIIRESADYIDLWLMSLCKHNITCYSTFSWWGAYLNKHENKLITYPRSAHMYIKSVSPPFSHTEYFLGAVEIEDV